MSEIVKSVAVHDYDSRLHRPGTKSHGGKCAWGYRCDRHAVYSLLLNESGVDSAWAACEGHIARIPEIYPAPTWQGDGEPPW